MKRATGLLLVAAFFAVVAVAAAGPPLDGKAEEAKEKAKTDQAEEFAKRAKEQGHKNPFNKFNKAGKLPWAGQGGKERITPEMMEQRRKASALFAAVVEPKVPKDVTFPLSEEDNLKFHASREGLMDWVLAESKQYDLLNHNTKKLLREKTTSNQDKTREFLITAVKAGKTLQQARVGLIIAQFEGLDAKTQEAALDKGRERLEKMPPGARDKAAARQLSKHQQELVEIKELKTDKEREEWVNKRYQPSVGKVPKMLE